MKTVKPNFKDILEFLYQNYYVKPKLSTVTSSYWEKYGGTLTVGSSSADSTMHGFGFGNLFKDTLVNRIKHIPDGILNRGLLNKYCKSQKIREHAAHVLARHGRIADFDSVKQAICANLISEKLPGDLKTIAVIGDGFGFMSSLMILIYPNSRIISVNLGKVLMFDAHYINKVFVSAPVGQAILIRSSEDAADRSYAFGFIEAENYHLLKDVDVDLFINIASMQEINMAVINSYFNYMRSGNGKRYFYCCNRITKQLPDGSWIEFFRYPWNGKDEVFLDELCPWYQKWPSNRPPFWIHADGPIQHRIVRLAKRDNIESAISASEQEKKS